MTIKPAVLITGASTGIGAVYADRFAKRGHDLVLVARDKSRLESLAERLRAETGTNVEVLQADLTDASELAGIEARVRDDASIGILVNNAGMSGAGSFIEQTPELVNQIITLNITALTRLSNAIAPRLARSGGGSIINLASVVGLAPELQMSVYGASKAFVLFLSQGLNIELGAKGLYVQAVLPSATRTEIWERSGKRIEDLQAVMEVEDLVDAALVGFDRRETVTIPPLPDETQWQALEAARQAMLPNYMQILPAARYRA
ncbi:MULTISPECIES: SDR family NAD(P)-dependent oxidoreductase [Pseudomonas]|uniref:SDR family NAD(P)-dependent oxidoreductase n=1 Tax=Pseudomonas TaxID=286 RepID=UPI002362A6D2|nr:SDR family oxidoreductase [Pseudomonas asplenii]